MNFLKLLFVGTLLLATQFLSAQEEVELSKRSEIKVNGLYLILGGFEVDYEHILNEESSVGLSLTYFFENDSYFKWGIVPHYRLFFGNQPALGFFVEGHAALYSYEDDYYDFGLNGSVRGNENRVSGGIGLALGGKFKTSRDIVVEVNAGIGRVFDNDNFDTVYPRFGINIGKRF